MKLIASSLNAVGLGVVAIGLIQPVFAGRAAIEWPKVVIAAVLYYILHLIARRVLGGLED